MVSGKPTVIQIMYYKRDSIYFFSEKGGALNQIIPHLGVQQNYYWGLGIRF